MTYSEPLYRTIATSLSESILNGTYTKGDKLPTEAKLCHYYNVSRVTLRLALGLLVDKNYVEKKRGSGSFVTYSKESDVINRSAKIISFSDEMQALGKTPSTKVITFEMQSASRKIATDLQLESGSPIFYYERILYGNDSPRSFETGYISAEKYPDLTLEHLTQSKFNYIETVKQQVIDFSHQAVTAIVADERLAEKLAVKHGTPLISLRLITYLTNGEVLDINTITFDSSQYQAHFIKYR